VVDALKDLEGASDISDAHSEVTLALDLTAPKSITFFLASLSKIKALASAIYDKLSPLVASHSQATIIIKRNKEVHITMRNISPELIEKTISRAMKFSSD
jgi:hypothetical protein